MDKFHYYLYGAQFIMKTDNNTLTHVLSSAKLSAPGHHCQKAKSSCGKEKIQQLVLPEKYWSQILHSLTMTQVIWDKREQLNS